MININELKEEVNDGRRYLNIESRRKLEDIVWFVWQLFKMNGNEAGAEACHELWNEIEALDTRELALAHIWD